MKYIVWKKFYFCIFISVWCFVLRNNGANGQKFSATAGVNKTVFVPFTLADKTSRSLTCLPDWQVQPQPVLTWDVTNAPMAVEGVDFVKSNGSIGSGVLWLSFTKLSTNITGDYVCVAVGPNGTTSYTTFDVYISGLLSIWTLVGIIMASIVLAIGAVYGAVLAAKRFGYNTI